MIVKLSVDSSRLATVCAFVVKAYQVGILDRETCLDLFELIDQNAPSFLNVEEMVVEHDPCGCPMLEEWLCRRRSA